MMEIADEWIIISHNIEDSDGFLMLRELSERENFEKFVHSATSTRKCDNDISPSVENRFSLIHGLDIDQFITLVEDSSIAFFLFEKSWHDADDFPTIFSYS